MEKKGKETYKASKTLKLWRQTHFIQHLENNFFIKHKTAFMNLMVSKIFSVLLLFNEKF